MAAAIEELTFSSDLGYHTWLMDAVWNGTGLAYSKSWLSTAAFWTRKGSRIKGEKIQLSLIVLVIN
jgi:hypothetical protein